MLTAHGTGLKRIFFQFRLFALADYRKDVHKIAMGALIALMYLATVSFAQAAASGTIHHKMDVSLDPATNRLVVTDIVTIPEALRTSFEELQLNSKISIDYVDPDITFTKIAEGKRGYDIGIDRDDASGRTFVLVDVYRVDSKSKGDLTFELRYSGDINYPVKNMADEYARSFSQSSGLINEEGIYLAGSTYWVPTAEDSYITYDVTTQVPEGWSVVSHGSRELSQEEGGFHRDRWVVTNPTEEIHLVGARFTEYEKQVGGVKAMAFLRSEDDALANKYLETTAQYLAMYQNLLGPYPYSKFALVENFWETGYGWPSFTLLGPQIIRFPFILHSSYPHELLHNWWGNGVFVDFDNGNWCEGLTAYMADHLVAEQRGQGAEFRRTTLQRYTNYATPENDFPLSQFVSRYDGITEAVGYGKNLMTWNMLREKVGDDNFVRAFQDFYRQNAFRRASYDDIRKSFEKVTGTNLKPFFDQWVKGTGAPEFRLKSANSTAKGDGYEVSLVVEQIQDGKAYDMDLPVAIYSQDGVEKINIALSKKTQTVKLKVTSQPTQIVLDPEFDVFRRLHYAEIPPSMSKMFGTENIQIVVPASAPAQFKERYQSLANLWGESSANINVAMDSDLDALPTDRSVWILGTENKFADLAQAELAKYNVAINETSIGVGEESVDLTSNSSVFVGRHPDDPDLAIAFLTAHSKEAIKGLAAKLPHYGKYSYLTFTGTEPTNVLKGQWDAVGSPMVQAMEGAAPSSAKLAPRPALAELAPVFSADRLRDHAEALSTPDMEGRGVGTAGLDKAADYIAGQFQAIGLTPAGDNGTWFQAFQTPDGPNGAPESVKNVVAVLKGKKAEMAGESVIVSAHYDHLGFGWPGVRTGDEGKLHPGADDNASGIAIMLELAEILSGTAPDRSIIFVATTAEEYELQGARHYAKTGADGYPIDKAIGNINLDTVGRLEDGKVMIFGGSSATEWRFIFMGATAVSGIETQMVAQEINASDHTAFHEAGIPAIHIFGSKASDYHQPTDTADKLDIDGMVKVAAIAQEAIVYLAERPEPLTKSGTLGQGQPVQVSSGRKVTTGSTPDFAFSGQGIKLTDIADGSPAAAAGLAPGDVVTHMAGEAVSDLRKYTNVLATFEPGQTVEVVYDRNGQEMKTQMTLVAR